jgi:hypothetical protein
VVDGDFSFVGGIKVIVEDNTPLHKPPRVVFAVIV